MSSRILLVEDEPGLVLTISDLLEAAGYLVETARDGAAGLGKALAGGHDLVILDVMLPKKSGFDVCREMRAAGNEVPVLMLTARSQVADRVTGLKLGADDYLGKPFDPLELLARVQARVRRAAAPRNGLRRLAMGAVEVDFEMGTAARGGESVVLVGKELQLLRYLAENRGRVVSREELLKEVWEYGGNVTSRTIDVHIAWLRQKLEDNPSQPRFIHTERGKGYRLAAEDSL